MLFFYVRHGDPTYTPDALTPLGERQAEAAAHRLATFGIDKIFASTSTRAMQTARPTCELLKKELTTLDFCNEKYAWEQLTVTEGERRMWIFRSPSVRRQLISPEMLALGEDWPEHPCLAAHPFREGILRVRRESDAFFASLGYEHIPGTGTYRCTSPTNERVALFAHQGFGLAFLSCLLDIPFPRFAMHFDMNHTGITAIDFEEEGGIAIPRVLTLSNDSHLYEARLPLDYNHEFRF